MGWYALEQRSAATVAVAERDAAVRERDKLQTFADAAIAERDRAIATHPILAGFGPDVWAYRRYVIRRDSGPVVVPIPTFTGGPTYTLRFLGLKDAANGETTIEGEFDSDRPLHDRPTVTIREKGVQRREPLVTVFGIEARPGCRATLGEAEVAVQVVVESVTMSAAELGIGARPNPGPHERDGRKLSSIVSICPERRP